METITEGRLEGAALDAWRSYLQSHASIVRMLDAELVAEHGMTTSDYEVLLYLAQADDRKLPMPAPRSTTRRSPARSSIWSTGRHVPMVLTRRCGASRRPQSAPASRSTARCGLRTTCAGRLASRARECSTPSLRSAMRTSCSTATPSSPTARRANAWPTSSTLWSSITTRTPWRRKLGRHGHLVAIQRTRHHRPPHDDGHGPSDRVRRRSITPVL